MSESRPTASVVVCAYTERRWDVLTQALSAAAAQLGPGDELLLVIDHNDALLTRCRELAVDVRLLSNAGESGLSGGRNTGVTAAGKDVVVFLDDDAVPEPGWLDALLAPYADPGVSGVGGVAAPEWTAPRPRWMPEEFLWVVGCTYRGIPATQHEVRNPIGANMSFRRSALAVAGGFAEGLGRVGTLPEGCEETELSIRLRKVAGARIVHTPASVVRHHVTEDRVRWRYFADRCRSEGRSKAAVARLQGADLALEAERAYALRVLPAGVLRGLREALRGDPGGLQRALAIVAGLLLTTAGYARGRARGGTLAAGEVPAVGSAATGDGAQAVG